MKFSFHRLQGRENWCRGTLCRWGLALLLGVWGTLPVLGEEPVRFGTTGFLSFRENPDFPFARSSAADRRRMLDLMREAGLRDLREALLQWGEVEPERGAPYDFSLSDGLVRAAGERGIEILGLFTALPLWATTDQPGPYARNMSPQDPRTFPPRREFEGDFRRFVYSAVRRYGSTEDSLPGLKKPVRYWEFYNEVDAGWWQDPEVYGYWLKAFYEEVKRADPEAHVVLAGLASAAISVASAPHEHAPDYLERLLASAALQGPEFPYFDVVNIHDYPMVYGSQVISGEVRREFMSRNAGLEPRGVITGYEPLLFSLNVMKAYLQRVMDTHQLQLPIWLTEIGDNSQFTGPREQAARLIKYLVHAASLGFERVYQFCFYDLGTEPGQGEWGLVKLAAPGKEPSHKPSFDAVKTFIKAYGDSRQVDFLGPGIYRLNYPDERRAYCLWRDSTTPPNTLPSEIRGRLRVVHWDGSESRLSSSQLKLTEMPVIVFTR